MAPGNDADTARRARATRSAGLLPLVIGLASAAALTGAAYFTVDSASCGAPAQYIRHDSHGPRSSTSIKIWRGVCSMCSKKS